MGSLYRARDGTFRKGTMKKREKERKKERKRRRKGKEKERGTRHKGLTKQD